MGNKELTRSKAFYEVKGVEVSLNYVRDALMLTYMGVPLRFFFELRGSLPEEMEARMRCLDGMFDDGDVELCEEVKTFILDRDDKELAEKYCMMDYVVWQLVVLTNRFQERDEVVRRIGKRVGSLLQNIFLLKKEVLHTGFFDFHNPMEAFRMEEILRKAEMERNNDIDIFDYDGWKQLEEIAKRDKAVTLSEKDALQRTFTEGKFGFRQPVNVGLLYNYLAREFTINGGADVGKHVIDETEISQEQFMRALQSGEYTGFKGHCRMKKLYFFICHFSRAYVYDKDTYREIAAACLGITRSNLESHSKDKRYAEGLQKLLPLIRYNNT